MIKINQTAFTGRDNSLKAKSSNNNISFAHLEDDEDEVEFSTKENKKENKPAFAAVISYLMPGLGQVYNNQAGKGALFFVVNAAVTTAALATGAKVFKNLIKESTPFIKAIAKKLATEAPFDLKNEFKNIKESTSIAAKELFEKKENKLVHIMTGLSLASFATRIASTVDAYNVQKNK